MVGTMNECVGGPVFRRPLDSGRMSRRSGRLLSQSVWWRCWLLLCAACGAGMVIAKPDSAATLLSRQLSLDERLRYNQFNRPLVLDSTETPNHLAGDVYAVVDYQFEAVRAGLTDPDHWCDVMLLHINTKYCRAVPGQSGVILRVNIGKKSHQELTDAPLLEFNFSVAAATNEFVDVVLSAKEGPLGTSNYRIQFQAVPLSTGRTFLHLAYSYAFDFSGWLAMQAYLGTVGSGKVGFTEVGKLSNGQPDFVGGVRGLVERNTMRYYLAIDSFLDSDRAAPGARFETRLQGWFTAVERYPRQLHEMDRAQYLQMKRIEYLRQQKPQ